LKEPEVHHVRRSLPTHPSGHHPGHPAAAVRSLEAAGAGAGDGGDDSGIQEIDGRGARGNPGAGQGRREEIREERPLPPSSLRLLIFDLDGTLVDSRADLVASVNATLEHLGQPGLPDELISKYVGNGAALLVACALGIATEGPAHAAALEFFLAHYAEHKLDRTTLYPDVAAGLAQLEDAGFALAVLSNKPVRPSREIVAGLGVAKHFFAVEGGNSFAQKKPDPVGILALAAARGMEPQQAAMIGDSSVDIRAGRKAGAVGLTKSHPPRPHLLRHSGSTWPCSNWPGSLHTLHQ